MSQRYGGACALVAKVYILPNGVCPDGWAGLRTFAAKFRPDDDYSADQTLCCRTLKALYQLETGPDELTINSTKPEFEG